MIIYLTYNDQPSGVYWSQVTDVVEHLNTLGAERVRLVALVSARGYLGTRRSIKAHSPSAWVIPMVPTMARWRKNAMILAWVCRMLHPKAIIARGVMATWMALRMRDRKLVQRVCFDGRGAYAAEWEEYRIIDDDALIAQFRPLENQAVNASDLRIAVSHALVGHWRERYGYSGQAHVVVPCTLGKEHLIWLEKQATDYGSPNTDLMLVYSGSTAGWQSFALLEPLIGKALAQQEELHAVFLSKEDDNNRSLQERYPERVHITWVSPEQVPAVLDECDMALMVREDTVTNRVASPTKFAEYLCAGLPVIISAGLGDFSDLVVANGLGHVVGQGQEPPSYKHPTVEERLRLKRFARDHFTKPAYDAAYTRLLAVMSA